MQLSKKKEQPLFLLFIEVFFTTFSIHINGFTGLFTLRNLAIMITIIVYCIFCHLKLRIDFSDKYYKRFFFSWVFILAYSVILIVLQDVSRSDLHNIFRSTFNFFVLVVVLPELICRIENRFERYSKIIILATVIQAVIVICSFLFPSIKQYLYRIQSFDDNWLSYRTVGLGIAGAGGTVYLFCGFMVISYCILFKEHSALMYIAQFIVLFAIILVGRTGFYMALATVAIVVVINIVRHNINLIKNMGKLILALIVAVIAISFIGSRVDINESLLQSSFRRLNELWTTGRTLQTISNMEVPGLTFLNFFIGTGLTKGYGFDGVRIWNDSGYVQRFFALGLLPAFLSYLCFVAYVVRLTKRINDRTKRIFWYCMLVLLMIIEYKEAFIFYLALPFTLIVSLKLEANKEESMTNEIR